MPRTHGAGAPDGEDFEAYREHGIETLHELNDIRSWTTDDGQTEGRIALRIVRFRGKRYLDIREFVAKRDGYTGFTRRGNRFPLHDVKHLIQLLPGALILLEAPPDAMPNATTQRIGDTQCNEQAATSAARRVPG